MSKKNNVKKTHATVRPACRQITGPKEIADTLALLPGSAAEKLSILNIWLGGKLPVEEAPKTLLNTMANRIFDDDATTELADIDRMARLIGFSIFDATISVIDHDLNTQEPMELVLAAFVLDRPLIFAWLIEHAMNGESNRLRNVYKEVFSSLEYFPDGHIRQKMAVALLRGQLKVMHEAFGLDYYFRTTGATWHTRPFGATILADFQAEIYAASEKCELEEMLTACNDDANDAPAGANKVHSGSIRM